jgi:hypothetical protein
LWSWWLLVVVPWWTILLVATDQEHDEYSSSNTTSTTTAVLEEQLPELLDLSWSSLSLDGGDGASSSLEQNDDELDPSSSSPKNKTQKHVSFVLPPNKKDPDTSSETLPPPVRSSSTSTTTPAVVTVGPPNVWISRKRFLTQLLLRRKNRPQGPTSQRQHPQPPAVQLKSVLKVKTAGPISYAPLRMTSLWVGNNGDMKVTPLLVGVMMIGDDDDDDRWEPSGSWWRPTCNV